MLALHLGVAAVTPYGLHRDEFLYLALGRHLDWGFLEVPPGIAVLARALQETIGTSVLAVRLLPAVAGAGLVLATGLMTRILGGASFSMLLSGLSVLIAPVYLRTHTLFQPVVFDQLWWTLGALFVMRRIATGDRRHWLLVGAACGLGLLTKYSILIFGAGLAAALLLTPLRRDLATPWPWLGALMALIAAAPNLAWQATHNWPLLSHVRALSSTQLVHVSRVDFLVEQVLMLHPLTFPIWGAGLVALFRGWKGRYRVLGWTFVACLGLLLILGGKPYYLAPAYPMLFAAGSCFIGAATQRRRWARMAVLAILLAGGVALAPLGLPVLSPPTMARYVEALGIEQVAESETGEPMRLPQDYADMLGWRKQVATVARVYHTLPAPARREALILAGNYGEAGAIDLYGASYDLPAATSPSSSYYLWGPLDRSGSLAVAIGLSQARLTPFFETCTRAASIRHEWAREREVSIVVCRDPHRPIQQVWPQLSPW